MSGTRWYSIRAAAREPRAAELWVYGDIGESWSEQSVIAADLVREVAALDADHLAVRINSYGGSVADGLAIYSAIKRHPARVTVSIDGVAASIASLIAMSGDTVEMAEGALLMIHAPWGASVGNALDMREFADVLDRYAQAMSTSYAAKTGRPVEEMLALLTDGEDHWFTAAEAHAAKFVDSVTTAMPIAASLDLSRFKVPADLAARFKGAVTMKNEDPQAAALAADQTRREAIASAFAGFSRHEGVSGLLAACQSDIKCDLAEAKSRLLAHLGRGAEPLAGWYHVDASNRGPLDDAGGAASPVALMSEALAYRCGGQVPRASNRYVHMRFPQMARELLSARGMSVRDLSDAQVVARGLTHTTGDFSDLLQSTANRILREAYASAPSGIKRIAKKTTAPDFRAKTRVMLGEWPELQKVPEGGEFKAGTMAVSKESYRLETYGRTFGITRQALINDDLGAFADMTRAFARAALETEARLLAALVTSNPAMQDTKALFHADHGNLAGTGAALDVTTLGAARSAMRLQKGLDGITPIDAAPKFLLVPAALETAAEQVVASIYATKPDDVNPFTGRLEVVVDPRLDATSAKAWYLFADFNVLDCLEYAHLESEEGPVVETRPGFEIDGVEIKCRLDFGAGAIDWRGCYRNDGPAG